MDTSRVLTRVLPVMRRCKVLSGTSTTSSWSLPKLPWPLEAEDADHLAGHLLHPAVPGPGPGCCQRVRGARFHQSHKLAAPARSSSSLNSRPSFSCQLPVVSQALLLPTTLDVQLRPLATRVALLARDSGATAADAANLAGDGGGVYFFERRALLAPAGCPGPCAGQGVSAAGWCPGSRSGFAPLGWRRCPSVTMVMTAAHADHDAQDGEEGAHEVAPDGAQREPDGIEEHQCTSCGALRAWRRTGWAFCTSLSITPSTKRTMRLA